MDKQAELKKCAGEVESIQEAEDSRDHRRQQPLRRPRAGDVRAFQKMLKLTWARTRWLNVDAFGNCDYDLAIGHSG